MKCDFWRCLILFSNKNWLVGNSNQDIVLSSVWIHWHVKVQQILRQQNLQFQFHYHKELDLVYSVNSFKIDIHSILIIFQLHVVFSNTVGYKRDSIMACEILICWGCSTIFSIYHYHILVKFTFCCLFFFFYWSWSCEKSSVQSSLVLLLLLG